MGSKRPILDALFSHIVGTVGSGIESFMDPMAGSCAVVQRANQFGWKTRSNDLLAISREVGTAYTQATTDETFKGVLDEPARNTQHGLKQIQSKISKAPSSRHNIFFDWYCPDGPKSQFSTNRGRTSRRHYFTAENARQIDRSLDLIRSWWQAGQLTRPELSLVIANLMANIERVANIKGTYAMPAASFQQGVKRPLPFDVHPELIGTANATGIVGNQQDALDFVEENAGVDVLYLDPPYNFRIYLDYYHIPCFIANYVFIEDVPKYSKKFEYVRAQNMADRPGGDHGKRFNNPKTFYSALSEVIEASRAKHVFISYFDGVNHENDFDEPDNSKAWNRLRTTLREIDGAVAFDVWEIPRKNMQSQKGRSPKDVNEYLFHVGFNQT